MTRDPAGALKSSRGLPFGVGMNWKDLLASLRVAALEYEMKGGASPRTFENTAFVLGRTAGGQKGVQWDDVTVPDALDGSLASTLAQTAAAWTATGAMRGGSSYRWWCTAVRLVASETWSPAD